MKEIIDELYARNIYVFLDFHQDIANESYGGDGFPDWALAIDKEHERPKASHPDKKWQIKYMLNKSLKQTFKSFWENKLTNLEEGLENFPVRTHLGENHWPDRQILQVIEQRSRTPGSLRG